MHNINLEIITILAQDFFYKTFKYQF